MRSVSQSSPSPQSEIACGFGPFKLSWPSLPRMMRPAVEIRFGSIISGHGDLRNAPFSLALIRHSNRVSAKIRFGCRETRFYEAETRAPKRPPKSCR
jgi:hypothetical protein